MAQKHHEHMGGKQLLCFSQSPLLFWEGSLPRFIHFGLYLQVYLERNVCGKKENDMLLNVLLV